MTARPVTTQCDRAVGKIHGKFMFRQRLRNRLSLALEHSTCPSNREGEDSFGGSELSFLFLSCTQASEQTCAAEILSPSWVDLALPSREPIDSTLREVLSLNLYNGHSMVGTLRRVLVCTPEAAGWNSPDRAARWKELGFQHPPDFLRATDQHAVLCHELESAGAEAAFLPGCSQLTLDAVYTHDPSLLTDFGAISFNTGKATRAIEAKCHSAFYSQIGIPIFGEVTPPAKAEAGDMVWLDAKTLLVGLGYRTSLAGVEQLRNLLCGKGVEVLTAPLPYGAGPSACLHLMSLISLLDEQTAIVDLPWLAVETVELLKARGYRFIEIEYSERETMACNVLSLGQGRLLAIAENSKTNDKLRHAGFDVRTFSGPEICISGGGGPTCLTRPLFRD
jgi:N-dimethylarginine dimethylaminohydrolase